jgi:hypothetical protein
VQEAAVEGLEEGGEVGVGEERGEAAEDELAAAVGPAEVARVGVEGGDGGGGGGAAGELGGELLEEGRLDGGDRCWGGSGGSRSRGVFRSGGLLGVALGLLLRARITAAAALGLGCRVLIVLIARSRVLCVCRPVSAASASVFVLAVRRRRSGCRGIPGILRLLSSILLISLARLLRRRG